MCGVGFFVVMIGVPLAVSKRGDCEVGASEVHHGGRMPRSLQETLHRRAVVKVLECSDCRSILSWGCVIAADSINAMRDHMECRKLAAAKKAVDSARLADTEVALKEV